MLFDTALRHRRGRLLMAVALGLASIGLGRAASASAVPEVLAQPGHVLILRHANAPGVGDPPGMTLGDCATQRNLDERGRKQAKRLGDRIRAAGAPHSQVYTSQWCRCRETARLMALGPVEDLTALNSFFDAPETRETKLAALREFLDKLPRDGRLVVLVTHQVTVTALTGHFPSSGEGIVLKLRAGGGWDRVAELPAAD